MCPKAEVYDKGEHIQKSVDIRQTFIQDGQLLQMLLTVLLSQLLNACVLKKESDPEWVQTHLCV